LFLVSNYTDTNYNKLGKLGCSRRSYHHVSNCTDGDVSNHGREEYRLKVHEYLKTSILLFNNGDPETFNQVFPAIFNGYLIAKKRANPQKGFESVNDTMPLVKRPLEIIKQLQTDFWPHGKKLIGGKIHDLTISNYGDFDSSRSRKEFGL